MSLFTTTADKARIDKLTKQVEALVADLHDESLLRKTAEAKLKAEADLTTVREQLETAKIEQARKVEAMEREKRETTHMVGLERKRQEMEAKQAQEGLALTKREATIGVREEALTKAEQRFTEQLKFMSDRFSEETTYLRDIAAQVLDRLPTVTVDRRIRETDGS